MIEKTVSRIEETVAGAPALSEEKKAQLLKLISEAQE